VAELGGKSEFPKILKKADAPSAEDGKRNILQSFFILGVHQFYQGSDVLEEKTKKGLREGWGTKRSNYDNQVP